MDERSCHAPRDERRRTDGWVEPGFEGGARRVRRATSTSAARSARRCACTSTARPVVDLWGGVADRRRGAAVGRGHGRARVLVDQGRDRGRRRTSRSSAACSIPTRTVAPYWPEFAAAGKDAITVRQVLSHQAGLPLVEGDFTLDEALSWDPIVEALAAPGAAVGARDAARLPHAHLRLARRRAAPPDHGRTPGPFLRDEVAEPLGLDFWIGLPEERRAARRPARAAAEQPPRAARAVRRDAAARPRVRATRRTCSTTTTCGTRGRCTRASCRRRTASATPARWPGCTRRCVGDGVDGRAHCSRPETVDAATVEQVRGPDAVIMRRDRPSGSGSCSARSFGAANPPSVLRPRRRRRVARLRRPGDRRGVRVRDERPALRHQGDPRSEGLVRAVLAAVD